LIGWNDHIECQCAILLTSLNNDQTFSTSLAGDVDGENVGPRFWKMKYTLMWLRVFGRSCSCAEFDIHIKLSLVTSSTVSFNNSKPDLIWANALTSTGIIGAGTIIRDHEHLG